MRFSALTNFVPARCACRAAQFLTVFGLVMLPACSSLSGDSGGDAGPTSVNAPAPTALTPAREAGGSALTGPVNEPELRKAVERYRVSKQRGAGHFDFAGVDLNGDGRAEAVLLFAGPDWCVRTGCSLVVFQEEATGYRPVSHVTRARPPIMVGPESNFGWRDLMVNTGGGPAPVRTVRLGFTGKGYPDNALLQPEPVAEMLGRAQQVIGESPGFSAAMTQLAAQSSAE